MDYTWKS